MRIPVVDAFVEWWVKNSVNDFAFTFDWPDPFDGALVIGTPFKFLGVTVFEAAFLPSPSQTLDLGDVYFMSGRTEYPALMVYRESPWHTACQPALPASPGFFDLCVDPVHVGKAYWVHSTIRRLQTAWRRRREERAFREAVAGLPQDARIPDDCVDVIVRALKSGPSRSAAP